MVSKLLILTGLETCEYFATVSEAVFALYQGIKRSLITFMVVDLLVCKMFLQKINFNLPGNKCIKIF